MSLVLSYDAASASFAIDRAGFWSASTVTLVGADLTGLEPNMAWAEAVLVRWPPSSISWVIVVEAAQSIVWLGAMGLVGGQLTVALSSVTLIGPVRGTVPVFLTL